MDLDRNNSESKTKTFPSFDECLALDEMHWPAKMLKRQFQQHQSLDLYVHPAK